MIVCGNEYAPKWNHDLICLAIKRNLKLLFEFKADLQRPAVDKWSFCVICKIRHIAKLACNQTNFYPGFHELHTSQTCSIFYSWFVKILYHFYLSRLQFLKLVDIFTKFNKNFSFDCDGRDLNSQVWQWLGDLFELCFRKIWVQIVENFLLQSLHVCIKRHDIFNSIIILDLSNQTYFWWLTCLLFSHHLDRVLVISFRLNLSNVITSLDNLKATKIA